MTDIEIILVNDKSNDESLNIVKNIKKTDKRIKLINNKKNMGTLYSRCIGALKAKGKYIFPLDNDDMFFDDDIFNIIYKEAYNFNYDIVGFRAIKAYSYKVGINHMKDDNFNHNNSFTIYKPKLSLFGISQKGRFKVNDLRIWCKCLKNSIYKKGVNSLGRKRYSLYISWSEDTSMVFVLFSVAESYRYIKKYGIFKLIRNNSASQTLPLSHKLFAEIFFLDILLEFTKNDYKSKKFAVYRAFNLRKCPYFKSLSAINIKFLKLTLKKLLSCSYINFDDKVKLKIR
jgi:glycosyltransferase involved in cell wall biosynthesis